MLKRNRILCLLLSVVLLCSVAPSVYAQDGEMVLRIISREGFLNFAENCRLDSYSNDLTVILCSDIDLTGTDFSGIPIFSGTFEGNGHTISGLSLNGSGSNTGLFRHLTDTACIKNLNVVGSVEPAGSASVVGGIAGKNEGIIQNCSFDGRVAGNNSIGGLVGINFLSGTIDSCQAYGSVHGNHFVGGIAGDNYGVIRDSQNYALINTTVEQNAVDLESITLDSILNSESASTVTDIGGICGTGTGVIRSCVNHARIGYPKMGYNVGGIAGSFSGYIYNCINRADVDGRKEVGGIIGQLEPAVNMIYEEDTMQTLQQQMTNLSNTAGGIGGSIQSGSNALNAQSNLVEAQLKDAQDALKVLLPDEDDDNYQPPDEESILAAQNALSTSLSGLTGSFSAMAQISQNTFGNVVGGLQSISGQMNAISGTINTASENLGGGIQDVSDADTDDDLTAKVRSCFNLGTIRGDWNIGGIAGAIGLENDLDPESDLQIIGNTSLNFDMELRAVILNCDNSGTVAGAKQNIGGIVGWVSMGLVKASTNTAAVDAASADYIGGIAGQSTGFLRSCYAKSNLSGDMYVGGIAGSGTTLSNCLSITQFVSAAEKFGAILGSADEPALLSNYYLVVGADPGAVDGVSYQNQAQPLPDDQFFALPDLPGSFRLVRVNFVFNDSKERHITLPYGCVLTPELMPDIPQSENSESSWTGPLQIGEKILHDVTYQLTSTSHLFTLESDLKAGSGLPQFLIQGQFTTNTQVHAAAASEPGYLAQWNIALPQSQIPMTLRCLIPAGLQSEDLRVMVKVNDQWHDTAFQTDGSYLVFPVDADTEMVGLMQLPVDYAPYIYSAIAVMAVAACIVLVLTIKRRNKRK